MTVPLEGINIWIGKLSKDLPPQRGWASSNPFWVQIKQKMEVGDFMAAWGEKTSIFSCPETPVLLDTTSFSGSPACRKQIVGLLVLHSHERQFL